MEVLPFALFYKREREVKFFETFFANIVKWADWKSLLAPAYEISSQYCIGAMDALHIAAAEQLDAEFISTEKPTKPIYKAYKNSTSIY